MRKIEGQAARMDRDECLPGVLVIERDPAALGSGRKVEDRENQSADANLAERAGFEPAVGVSLRTLSRRVT